MPNEPNTEYISFAEFLEIRFQERIAEMEEQARRDFPDEARAWPARKTRKYGRGYRSGR